MLHRLMGCCLQNVLYTQSELESENPQVLLDPNKLSEDGTVRLSAQSAHLPSPQELDGDIGDT